MRWAFKVGRLAGVDVFVHATFLILLVWIGVSHWLRSHSVAATIDGVLFIVALFACVLLHELGHTTAAARFGIKTRDIILLPIGGLARLERMPDKPIQELWVALAGPLVNLVIAVGLWLGLRLADTAEPLESVSVVGGSMFTRLMVANVIILLFNLIPAFPMDGGRVLRALLAMRLGPARATGIAATVGQGLALLFGLLGMFFNPFLIFIALFVWIGAAQEAAAVQTRSALIDVPLASIVERDVVVLGPESSIDQAVQATLTGAHKDFPVVVDGRVVGVLTQTALLRALAAGTRPTVGEIMDQEIVVADVDEAAESAFARLQTQPVLPVTANGQLLGVVTHENIRELRAIQAALAGARRNQR